MEDDVESGVYETPVGAVLARRVVVLECQRERVPQRLSGAASSVARGQTRPAHCCCGHSRVRVLPIGCSVPRSASRRE